MVSYDVLRVDPSESVGLLVRDLTVSVPSKGTKKSTKSSSAKVATANDVEAAADIDAAPSAPKIIDNVSFKLEPGSMMAIMGGSGSGKTTLLNTLSQRLNHTSKGLDFAGEICYISGADSKTPLSFVKNAYMLQTDCFLPGLTVYETLKFQADLRMPANTSEDEKAHLIESLLDVLELQLIKHEIICTFASQKTNLSGGEQRRVTLAIQLLSKPSILFLDEPTTGLDTSSSLKLVKTLRKLSTSEYNVTVILSIHQPRPEISVMFDKICLLTRGGRVVYFGNLVDSWNYFQRMTFLTENDTTDNTGATVSATKRLGMEYIMDLSVKDTTSTEEREQYSIERINKLVAAWKESPQLKDMMNSQSLEVSEQHHLLSEDKKFDFNLKSFSKMQKSAKDGGGRISLFREIVILTKRTFLLTYRDSGTLLSLNGGASVLAAILGWMFFQPKHDIAGIRSITSALYILLEVIGFCPMFIEIERLWATDIIFFYREYKENYVSISGFLISRRLGKFLLEDLPLPSLFAVITYFMFGLRVEGSASYFFIYLAIAILTQLISMASALLIVALSPDFTVSTAISNIYYQLQNSGCGYFINAATMPVYVRWVKYIAFFWYAFGALTSNQYTDWVGDCSAGGDCFEVSGNLQLEILGYPENWIAVPIVCMVAYFFILQLLITVALYFKDSDIKVAKTKVDRISKNEEKKEQEEVEEEEVESSPEEANHESSPTPQNLTVEPKFETVDSNAAVGFVDTESVDIRLENITLSVMVKDHDHPESKKSTVPLLFGKTKKIPKVLLNDINAHFCANTVNAIMGPSGSGKTTLLNFLSNRLSSTSTYSKESGSIKLNKKQTISSKDLSTISAYVTQHDTALIPNLTVRETLYYQAKLRLPREEHHDIPSIISKLIRRIGLSDCADTLIGNEFKKGISGGEKRRVSIAIQLLNRPKILFLDEPTSGLDSTTACSILTLLNDLAKETNATIITTIHQPSEDLFLKFSNVLLLARGGKVAFNGNSDSVSDYFKDLGFSCPRDINIADFFLDLVSVGLDETTEQTQARVLSLVDNWSSHALALEKLERIDLGDSIHSDAESELSESNEAFIDITKYHRDPLPISITFTTIASRQLLNTFRSGDVVFARVFQTVLLAIIHTLFFAPLKNSQEGISNRLGLVQEVLNLYFVGLVNNISLFPIERDIFYQEYSDGIYGAIEFSAAYLVNELPLEIIPCLFFSAMIVFVAGLPRTPGMYFGMFFSSFASINCGESLGIFVNCIFNHLGMATNILSNIIIVAIFMGGTMSIYMPEFFKAWNYINPMKYAVGICANLGFQDQIFECPKDGSGADNNNCALNSGANVLKYYRLKDNLGGFFGGMAACLILYRAIAIAVLYIKVKWRR